MVDLEEYKNRLSRMDYRELCNERKHLEAVLEEYEAGIPKEDVRWKSEEDPDVVYFRTLRCMSVLFSCLSEEYLKEMEKTVLAYSRKMTAVKFDFTDDDRETN